MPAGSRAGLVVSQRFVMALVLGEAAVEQGDSELHHAAQESIPNKALLVPRHDT